MASVIVVNIWRGFPFFGISFLAGMKAIPAELYEAAAVDGANVAPALPPRHAARLRNIVIIVVLLSTIWTFNDFGIVYILTKGGPGGATMVLPVFTYEMAFGAQRLGRGHRGGALHAARRSRSSSSCSRATCGRGRRDEQGGRSRALQTRRLAYGVLGFLARARAVPVLLDDDHVVQERGPDAEPRLHVLAVAGRRWRTTGSSSRRPTSSPGTATARSWRSRARWLATAVGTIGAYALARLKFMGRAFMSSAVAHHLPGAAVDPVHPALRADPDVRALRQPGRPHRRLSVVHGAVRDLAARWATSSRSRWSWRKRR